MRNAMKQGPEVFRKNGCLINTGDNLSQALAKKLREQNKKKFGLSTTFV